MWLRLGALALAATVAGCNSVTTTNEKLSVISGRTIHVDFYNEINADCSSMGAPVMRVTQAPLHGRVTSAVGLGFPSFPKDNQRHHCNTRRVQGTHIYYVSNPGFTGQDRFALDVIWHDGVLWKHDAEVQIR